MQKRVEEIFRESIAVQQETLAENRESIVLAVALIVKTIRGGNKIIIFGNGGSAADSQHMAAELIGRFRKERKALPAIALTTDTSCITALGNDYGFDVVFSRPLEAIAAAGDTVIAISTSGNSRNVLAGVATAKDRGLKTISLTGGKGGKLAPLTDVSIIVPSTNTARVQEAHTCVLHCLCELVEEEFS